MTTYIERPRYACALGGALVTIQAMDRAVAIVHASPGCASTSDASSSMGSGYWGTIDCTGRSTPSTNLLEREIVFGGEERLAEQIRSTLQLVDADLYAVITGCMTDIIGDDVKAVVENFRRDGHPVIVAETGGFKGNSVVGYDLLWKALIAQFVSPDEEREAHTVNLLGLVPSQDVFWRGDLLEIKRLLQAIGVKANAFVAPFEGASAVRSAGSAALNIVLSENSGHLVARSFEERHGIPHVTLPLPLGPSAGAEFLRSVGQRLGIDSALVEAVIAEEQRWYYGFLQHVADLYNDQDFQRHAVIVGNATYAYSVTRFLADDLGWLPYCAVITDVLDDQARARLVERFETIKEPARPKLLFETNTFAIREAVTALVASETAPYGGSGVEPLFVLGSSLDRALAADLKAGFFSVSYPIVNRVVTDQGYAGFRGGLRLATDLLSALVSNR